MNSGPPFAWVLLGLGAVLTLALAVFFIIVITKGRDER